MTASTSEARDTKWLLRIDEAREFKDVGYALKRPAPRTPTLTVAEGAVSTEHWMASIFSSGRKKKNKTLLLSCLSCLWVCGSWTREQSLTSRQPFFWRRSRAFPRTRLAERFCARVSASATPAAPKKAPHVTFAPRGLSTSYKYKYCTCTTSTYKYLYCTSTPYGTKYKYKYAFMGK